MADTSDDIARERSVSAEVYRFGAGMDQTRACGFDIWPGLRVLVTPSDAEQNDAALAAAERLAGDAARLASDAEKLRSAEARVVALLGDLQLAVSKIPPKNPTRMLGVGWARFDERGGLWVLGSREKGWASFGYWLAGWDDLFRRFAVRVTDHGSDDIGLWWKVENTDERMEVR